MEMVTTCTCRILEGTYPGSGEPTTWVIPDETCTAPEHEE